MNETMERQNSFTREQGRYRTSCHGLDEDNFCWKMSPTISDSSRDNDASIGYYTTTSLSTAQHRYDPHVNHNDDHVDIDPIESRRQEMDCHDYDPIEMRRMKIELEHEDPSCIQMANSAPAVSPSRKQQKIVQKSRPSASVDAAIEREEDLFFHKETRQQPQARRAHWWRRSHCGFVETSSSTDEQRDVPEQPTIQPQDFKQMRAIYHAFGGTPTDHVLVEELAKEVTPDAPDHVLVKILACTVTLEDCMLRRGLDFQLTDPVSLPAIPGHDFVGVIVQRGEKAQTFPMGSYVAGLVRTGGCARFISVAERDLAPVPVDLDPAEAVCMVSVYATAYQCLKMVSRKNIMFSLNGKKALIVGGMDGVSLAMIQLCQKGQAECYTTAPIRRHEYIRTHLGVTPLPENSLEWPLVVEHEMDFIFDGVCQNGMSSSSKALKKGGSLVSFAQASILKQKMGWLGAPLSAHLERRQTELLLVSDKTKYVDLWESYKSDRESYQKNLQALFEMLRCKRIQPIISKRVSLDEVGLCHHKLEAGEIRGNVVCLPWKRVSRSKITKENQII